jgi:hypothetical protein
VEGLTSRAERDELLDAARAGLGFLRRLHAPEDRVAIAAVERIEEGPCPCVAGEGAGEVCGNLRNARAIVSGLDPIRWTG